MSHNENNTNLAYSVVFQTDPGHVSVAVLACGISLSGPEGITPPDRRAPTVRDAATALALQLASSPFRSPMQRVNL